jgi:RecB family exonuclease
VPVGHLSYSALDSYSRCHYRFYVERVIGLRSPLHPSESNPEGVEEPGAEADELVDPDADITGDVGLAIGRAVHAALEWSARHAWAEPGPAELGAILLREGLADDPGASSRVGELVGAWLSSGMRARLEAESVWIRPEAPFVIALGGTIVRGKIDLLAELAGGELLVVDYKTNALGGAAPAELASRYATQRDIYALAVHESRRNGSSVAVETAYCFLEDAGRPVLDPYDEARLGEARHGLEALVAGIRAGDFARTDAPHPALCHGCPAAARLCAKPAWRPSWARATAR